MVVWIRDSLSQGSLASMRSVSSTIPKIRGQWMGPPPYPRLEGCPALHTLRQVGSSCADNYVSWEDLLSDNHQGNGAERLYLD